VWTIGLDYCKVFVLPVKGFQLPWTTSSYGASTFFVYLLDGALRVLFAIAIIRVQ
jgi:hypothetical protein